MPKAPRPKKEAPPKPWQRAEAGRYRSSDDRFTLEAESSGRWFVTDAEELDELGLARTSGPFATLDEAKAAADASRARAPEASPLAGRLQEIASRPASKAPKRAHSSRPARTPPGDAEAEDAEAEDAEPEPEDAEREPEPAPPPRTWLDDLEDRDRDAARTARRMIDALGRDGIDDADALVRKDLLGGEPAIATRLLAREVRAAIEGLGTGASPTAIAAAVADVLAGSRKRAGLPGWRLVEQDHPAGERRGLRLTPDDLRR